IPGGHDPVRVVVSGRRLDLPRRARVLAPGGPPTIVVAPVTAPSRRVTALRGAGVEVLLLPARTGRMSFARIMAALGARGFTSVLVEGGGTVAAEALRAGVVDRAVLFVAPALLGGDGVPAVGPLGIRRVTDVIRLTRTTVRRIGDDLVVQGRPRWRRYPLPPAGSRGTVGR
ncbi:MAG TPA: RibD family protein, partial [Candidatus Binatia bacterium]|nr:RibD family protein [Candidatus Binatia bacterium]